MSEPDVNKIKSDAAVRIVRSHLEDQGYECEDVSRNTEYLGFDILAKKGSSTLKIEVKGSSKESGIPDCYWNEFDSQQRLIADYLYIVRLNRTSRSKRIEVLSKKEVDRYASEHIPLRRIRMAARLKTDLKNGRIGKFVSGTGRSQPSKGSYTPGTSCLMQGKKHNYVLSQSRKTYRCTNCNSVESAN
jgi:hypothetical protein